MQVEQMLETAMPQLSLAQRDQLKRYYELLIDWNGRMNLTAITEPQDVVNKHFLDSLAAVELLPSGGRCIDVGTGAGFPGIVLLVARPDIKMTLLDSLKKRISFLETVCLELGINAQCVHGRAEDVARQPQHRGRYEVALSRAVAPLNVLLELTVPFLRPHGVAIAYKGPAAQAEAAQCGVACKLLGCTVEVKPVEADYGERYLAIAKKVGPVPEKYPRKAGEPGRKPLG